MGGLISMSHFVLDRNISVLQVSLAHHLTTSLTTCWCYHTVLIIQCLLMYRWYSSTSFYWCIVPLVVWGSRQSPLFGFHLEVLEMESIFFLWLVCACTMTWLRVSFSEMWVAHQCLWHAWVVLVLCDHPSHTSPRRVPRLSKCQLQGGFGWLRLLASLLVFHGFFSSLCRCFSLVIDPSWPLSLAMHLTLSCIHSAFATRVA